MLAKSPKGDVIKVTPKTYRVLYESRGFVLVDEISEEIEEKSKDDAVEEDINYEDLKVAEIKEILDSKGIEYKENTRKANLIKLIEY